MGDLPSSAEFSDEGNSSLKTWADVTKVKTGGPWAAAPPLASWFLHASLSDQAFLTRDAAALALRMEMMEPRDSADARSPPASASCPWETADDS